MSRGLGDVYKRQVYSEIKKKPIRHIDTISAIWDTNDEISVIRQIIAMTAFNKHPINAIKDAVLKLVILILLGY